MNGYTPNHISVGKRIFYSLLSVALLAYGTFGIITDDLYLPGRISSPSKHYHGEPAWVLYGALLCAALNFLSVVVDHFDKRNNETNYKQFAKVTFILGWTLLFLAIALDILVFHKATKG